VSVLTQHADNDIVGEALIALLHDDLKSMGITSVGHRLTILKSVYDVKKAQDVPIESDHYIPLCEYSRGPVAGLLLLSRKRLC
jgi:protein STE50